MTKRKELDAYISKRCDEIKDCWVNCSQCHKKMFLDWHREEMKKCLEGLRMEDVKSNDPFDNQVPCLVREFNQKIDSALKEVRG